MTHNPTPPVGSRYGAPMGRHTGNPDPDATRRFALQHVPIDSGGYDRGGAYWGLGAPLYWYRSGDGTAESFIRIDAAKRREVEALLQRNGIYRTTNQINRLTAKAMILDAHPGAKFNR